jgi:rubrerythrin
MKLFDASEIYRFAMRIEENGEKFYRHAAQITEDEEARYLFNFLADEEIVHGKIFGRLLSKLETTEPDERYPGEYLDYLRDYLDNKVIFSKKKMEDEFQKVKDTLSATNFSINREMDSILYYSEIKNLVAASQQEAIEKIIAEERRHFAKLTEFKRDYEKRHS